MTAIVLDTETTGLNPKTDRVIQVGAVRMNSGKIDHANPLDVLVNPGVHIPAESTRIHGITDAAVRDAEAFPKAMEQLEAFHTAPLIIGYSIGFDLSALKHECARHGLAWTPPSSLDVQLLAQIVAPNLPDKSLDTLANWLDVEVEGRHTALGDAITTARVYKALIPKLAEKDIFTYVGAQRVCNRLTLPAADSDAWHDIRDTDAVRTRGVNEFARIDSFPYRHRVSDLMSSPPATRKGKETLKDALDFMMPSSISSVFVAPDKKGGETGIVTEKDVLRLIQAKGAGVLSQTLSAHASGPLITIREGDYLYKAIARMADGDIGHLGVLNEAGELTGALTARDLLKQRSLDASILGDNLNSANSAEELATIWLDLTRTARSLHFEEVDPRNIAAIISLELRELTRRACEISEQEMVDQGKGSAPCPWAMLVLGSAGRGESLLAMDQDNAIIYAKGDPGGDNDVWFEQMGTRATHILNQVGVPLCKGNIMASNAEWRRNEDGWRNHVEHWITRSNPQDILNSDIFFDAMPVCGDGGLFERLERDALEAASQARNFLQLLSLNAGQVPGALGWFGKIKTRNGRLDVKWNGLLPVFSAARVLAIKNKVNANSTPDRLDAVAMHERAIAKTLGELKEAHRIFLGAILKQQLEDIDVGIPISNNVSVKTLSSLEREQLHWALEKVQSVPDVLGVSAAV